MPNETTVWLEVHVTEPDGTTFTVRAETTHGETIGIDALAAALDRQRASLDDPDQRSGVLARIVEARARWRRSLYRFA